MFTRNELIEALTKEGMVFEEVCDFAEGGQIKWESKFDEVEADQGETGFDPFMSCDIDDEAICFTSVLNSKAIFFNRDFPNPPTLEEVVTESKHIIETFYRWL